MESYPWKPDIDYLQHPEKYKVGKGEQGVANDFVGADMARKYLQMGYTRARRYANYKGGKKYNKEQNYKPLERGTGSAEKAKSASIFYAAYKKAEANPVYAAMKKDWKKIRG